MIVSTRVFLILLVPLLVQGAGSQTGETGPQQHWMHTLLLGPPGDAPSKPPPPSHQAPEPWRPPHDYILLPGSISENVDYREADLRSNACLLPPGTECRPFTLSASFDTYQTIHKDSIGKTTEGGVVLLPRGTLIRISRSRIIRLPTGTTRARHIEADEVKRIEDDCLADYVRRRKKHPQSKIDRTGREPEEDIEFVERCLKNFVWRKQGDDRPTTDGMRLRMVLVQS